MRGAPTAAAACSVAALAPRAAAHGWLTTPASRQELNSKHHQDGMPTELQYEPQSANGPNSCGSSGTAFVEGAAAWQAWYGDALPTLVPGGELRTEFKITADHGGQAWMMVACADKIAEDAPWRFLQRAPGDRDRHYLPSNPAIYAWATSEASQSMGSVVSATWSVPADLKCAGSRAVGRWLWKDGNSCNDANNVGRKTETFSMDEYTAVVHAFDASKWVQPACTTMPEQFISCVDFALAASVGNATRLRGA